MLIILGGLPGVGKTTIARELAQRIGAVHVRIDSIEQGIRDSGVLSGPMNDAGYRAAYAVAEDNLRLGRTVIADSVNPIAVTRDAWRAVAERAGVEAVEVEIVCSDVLEHRRRVEGRLSDSAGLRLPSWRQVVERAYEPWSGAVVDTAGQSVEQSVERVEELVKGGGAGR
jgi:predicted kinase